MAEDKTLTCRDCGEKFTFTTGEQEFYSQKGFTNEPTRCAPCRKAKKMQRSSTGAQFRDRDDYGSGSSGSDFGRSRY